MTGKNSRQKAEGRRQKAEEGAAAPRRTVFTAFRLLPSAFCQRGFTLLELMIVISIIVILALIVLPQYNRTVQATREAVLRDDLYQMRKMIRQYAADKGQLPDSLDSIVGAGYLSEIPEDPMTGRADWNAVFGDDPNLTEGGNGLVNVCSSSTDQALDGSTYNDCERW